MGRADSVTLDPHKLGYVPYACGAFVAKNPENYRTYSPAAPYLQAGNRSRWAFTLEGSRSGAGVTATWLSNRVMGLDRDGYGRLLEKGVLARDRMLSQMEKDIPDLLLSGPPDLNIICFCLAKSGELLTQVNARSARIFEAFEASPRFSISRTELSSPAYGRLMERLARERSIVMDTDRMIMLRLVLMNPFVISKETKVDFVLEFVRELKDLDAGSTGTK
jgi:hypothetical protein